MCRHSHAGGHGRGVGGGCHEVGLTLGTGRNGAEAGTQNVLQSVLPTATQRITQHILVNEKEMTNGEREADVQVATVAR